MPVKQPCCNQKQTEHIPCANYLKNKDTFIDMCSVSLDKRHKYFTNL